MKKIITSILIISMITTLFTACSFSVNYPESSDVTSNTSSEAEQTNTTSDVSETSSDAASSSSDLFSWQFTLEGDVYTLPCDFSAFEDNGWSIEEDDNLETGKYTFIDVVNGDKKLTIYFYNNSGDTLPYSQCQVVEAEVELNDEIALELPGGFTFDDTVTIDNVKAQYGEPDNIIEGTISTSLEYRQDVYQLVKFTIYEDDMKGYSSVKIENFGDE